MEGKKKISSKTAIIIIVSIIVLAILYFLFFVVDIVSYIKNYDYIQEAGQRADELHNEIRGTVNEVDKYLEEHNEYLKERNELLDILEK